MIVLPLVIDNSGPCLVTNWHVICGRHPEKPQETLWGYKTSPTHIQLHLTKKGNDLHFMPGEYLPLYDREGQPVWLESPLKSKLVDIAVIPIIFPDDSLIHPANEIAPSTGTALEPGIPAPAPGKPSR
ncbi:hypothetical protein N2599_13880 [Rhizobium sullae]|uniref:Uncharacterized protein n=1 Tax=Rhizobium sullae TaxID=50338 RepID=A0ABY5XF92_RHISU|nr:hypothetical protein [Rhizobium sullae]UWU13234.1 hypothetical protein N2599_13880 [Rhizobium sullae]